MDDNSSITSQRGHELIVEPSAGNESEQFSNCFKISVEKTRDDLINACSAQAFGQPMAFQAATDIVKDFRPVPWFVWRLTNFVFSPGTVRHNLPEGFVLGLRRLLFATASDPIFGEGEKVNSLRQALAMLSPEVVGAVSAVHAICRRLTFHGNDRIWRPILDDALIRARIGYHVGAAQPEFGGGRGILAGFIGRIGLAVAIARGGDAEARQSLELIAQGKDAAVVCGELYGCHPLYIGSMILSAIGCGGHASLGVLAHLATSPHEIVSNFEQRQWLAAYSVTEAMRAGTPEIVELQDWQMLELEDQEAQEKLLSDARRYIRHGHGLAWLI